MFYTFTLFWSQSLITSAAFLWNCTALLASHFLMKHALPPGLSCRTTIVTLLPERWINDSFHALRCAGHGGRRINCSPPSGIYKNQGSVKAATSADTADLVSIRVLCEPLSCYCTVLHTSVVSALHAVFFLIQLAP